MEREAAPCREGVTAEDRLKEADRQVLYGALLVAHRPQARVKAEIVEAVQALLPAVQAYLNDSDDHLAAQAQAYADACGGRAFLESKRTAWKERA